MLALALAVATAVAPGDSCPTLTATRVGDGVAAFVGRRGAGLVPGSVVPVAGGCGAGDPAVHAALVTPGPGQWEGRPLPGLTGLPFDHRGQTWMLRLARPVDGRHLFLAFAPLDTERSSDSNRIDRAENAVRHAVATIDEWTFLVVEQGDGPFLLLRHFTSDGSIRDMSAIDEIPVAPSWPDGAEIVGADGTTEGDVVFARTADQLVGTRRPGGALPRLALPAGAIVAGLWYRGGPAAFVLAGTRLELHRLDDTAWRLEAESTCPEGSAIAAAASGIARDRAVAFVLGPGRLHGRAYASGSWEAHDLDLDDVPSPGASSDAMARRSDDGPGLPAGPSALLAVVAMAGLAALGLFVRRWRRGLLPGR